MSWTFHLLVSSSNSFRSLLFWQPWFLDQWHFRCNTGIIFKTFPLHQQILHLLLCSAVLISSLFVSPNSAIWVPSSGIMPASIASWVTISIHYVASTRSATGCCCSQVASSTLIFSFFTKLNRCFAFLAVLTSCVMTLQMQLGYRFQSSLQFGSQVLLCVMQPPALKLL
jgi:hypothetical protein